LIFNFPLLLVGNHQEATIGLVKSFIQKRNGTVKSIEIEGGS